MGNCSSVQVIDRPILIERVTKLSQWLYRLINHSATLPDWIACESYSGGSYIPVLTVLPVSNQRCLSQITPSYPKNALIIGGKPKLGDDKFCKGLLLKIFPDASSLILK